MNIIHNINELRTLINQACLIKKRIGFVPTMGALHEGHISLVRQCKAENDICVASIFVNPTQFNDRNDLIAYPRTPDKDCDMLKSAGCDIAFIPSEDEMYPEPDTREFALGSVAEVMEGKCRTGHFNGVAQIVSKLFEIVTPHNAYFGEKDFQQIAVIRELVRQLRLPVNIVACPIVREDDGLAMSSRNMRLTSEQRRTAPVISHILNASRHLTATMSVREVETWVVQTLNTVPCLRVEYYEIVDGDTLQSIDNWNATTPIGCIAAFCGEVRLIDNIKY